MELFVNGEKTSCKDNISLQELLDTLGYEKKRIAVEKNGEIIPKASYEQCKLGPADKLEIVTFVGGG